MTVENEKTISEKPATHQKKAQYILIGILALIIISVLISALFRDKTKVNFDNEKAKPVRLSQSSENQENFNDKFNKETQLNKLNRNTDSKESTNSNEQLITKLEKKRDGLAKRLNPPNKNKKNTLDEWEKKERDRVRDSRYDDFKISLGFDEREKTITDNNYQYKSGSSIKAKKSAVQAEIARVTKLKNELQSGELTTQQVQDRFANNSFSSFNEPDQPSNSQLISSNNRPRTVGRVKGKDNINPNARLLPISTTIRAALDNKIISDYPSVFRCIIIENVYDATNQFILIPVGSKCNGNSLKINNVNEPIQARMGLTINNVILPNGNKIDFSKQHMLDHEGISAVKDEVNRHFLAQFLGIAAYALISEETSREGSGSLSDQTFSGEAGAAVRKQYAPLAAKYLRLVPTVTLGQGTPLRIFIENEIYIEPWEQVGESLVRNF